MVPNENPLLKFGQFYNRYTYTVQRMEMHFFLSSSFQRP